MADCSYCGQKAGFLRRKHKDCETAYRAGRRQMVSRVAQAAGAADFSEAKLREDLAAIASACYIAEAENRPDHRRGLAPGYRREPGR